MSCFTGGGGNTAPPPPASRVLFPGYDSSEMGLWFRITSGRTAAELALQPAAALYLEADRHAAAAAAAAAPVQRPKPRE